MTQYQDLEGVPLDAYNKCCNELLIRAQMQLSLPREKITLRDLISDDLGIAGIWEFVISNTLDWNTLLDHQVADNRFICISGMFSDTDFSLIHSIKITRAGSLARWWNVQRVGFVEDHEMHVDDPIIVGQNQRIQIEGYNALTTSTVGKLEGEKIGFFGCVAEPLGKLINP